MKNRILQNLNTNRRFYLSCIIIAIAIYLSFDLLRLPIGEFNRFDKAGPNPYLGDNGPLLREMLIMYLLMYLLKIFLIWMIAFSSLFLVKNYKVNIEKNTF